MTVTIGKRTLGIVAVLIALITVGVVAFVLGRSSARGHTTSLQRTTWRAGHSSHPVTSTPSPAPPAGTPAPRTTQTTVTSPVATVSTTRPRRASTTEVTTNAVSPQTSNEALPGVPETHLVGMDVHLAVRPRQIVFSGDGYVGMDNITWRSWGQHAAVGAGDYYASNCTPSCVDGTMSVRPATIRLSAPVGSKYGMEFSVLTWTVQGEEPRTISLS